MLTKEDKDWAVDNFVTRGEYRSDMFEIKGDLKSIKKSVDKVLNAVDKYSGRVADLEQENKFGSVMLQRHGAQIHELATATGTTLSE